MKFLERTFDHQNQWWKYLIVVFVGFFVGQIVGSIPLFGVLIYKVITSGGSMMPNPSNMADFSAFGISKNTGLLLMMLPFIVSLLLTIWLIKSFHQRTLAETMNGTRKIRFGRLWVGFIVWTVLMIVYLTGDYLLDSNNFVLQFNLAAFIPLLLIGILLIPFQSGYEEILCRGYLTQGITALTRNRLLAILLPGLFFGLLHSFNPEVKEFGFGIAMTQYIFLGLLFGLIAVLDDGIELCIGMHAANNIFLSLMVTHKSSALQTNAVFEQLNLDPVKDAISLIVIGIIAIAFLSYRYKWNYRILLQSVKPANDNNNSIPT